jgi:hypothetical protein
MRVDWTVPPVGRLELPKPCGLRPESVEFPCAFQLRVEFPGRALLMDALALVRLPPVMLAGGRFAEIRD